MSGGPKGRRRTTSRWFSKSDYIVVLIQHSRVFVRTEEDTRRMSGSIASMKVFSIADVVDDMGSCVFHTNRIQMVKNGSIRENRCSRVVSVDMWIGKEISSMKVSIRRNVLTS